MVVRPFSVCIIVVFTFPDVRCGICKHFISPEDTYYHCPTPRCVFNMCEGCYFEEEYHKHQLVKQKGILVGIQIAAIFHVSGSYITAERVKFDYKDPRTQNRVLVGEYPTAIPNSRTITKNRIVAGTRSLQSIAALL